MMPRESTIKSKDRVKEHGEVFTPNWVVRDMLDMLIQQGGPEVFTDITKTFLEPACGTGNFLVEILIRKLVHCNTPEDGLTALSSLFGVDIMEDNVEEAKARLEALYELRFGPSDKVRPILDRNIVVGNFLTMMGKDGKPIWFLEEYLQYATYGPDGKPKKKR